MSFLLRCAALAAMNLAVVQSAFAEADPHSYAQPQTVRVTSLALDLSVSFDKHELAGSATLNLDWHDKAARELVLDTNDLAIEKVEVADKAGHWSPAK
mgnify:CR=1 FL=1